MTVPETILVIIMLISLPIGAIVAGRSLFKENDRG